MLTKKINKVEYYSLLCSSFTEHELNSSNKNISLTIRYGAVNNKQWKSNDDVSSTSITSDNCNEPQSINVCFGEMKKSSLKFTINSIFVKSHALCKCF